jgi:hypothetical protein
MKMRRLNCLFSTFRFKDPRWIGGQSTRWHRGSQSKLMPTFCIPRHDSDLQDAIGLQVEDDYFVNVHGTVVDWSPIKNE